MANNTVVHAHRITLKNGIATPYCDLIGKVIHVQTNKINIWILPYKCLVMQKYLVSCTDIPYHPGTVNYAMMNETAKITNTIFI